MTQRAPSTDWGSNVEHDVREALRAASPEIARALERHPEAVTSSESDHAKRLEWMTPNWRHVLVLTEMGIGDPYGHKRTYAAFQKAVAILKKDTHAYADAGWDSINPAVQYFWIEPSAANPSPNPSRSTLDVAESYELGRAAGEGAQPGGAEASYRRYEFQRPAVQRSHFMRGWSDAQKQRNPQDNPWDVHSESGLEGVFGSSELAEEYATELRGAGARQVRVQHRSRTGRRPLAYARTNPGTSKVAAASRLVVKREKVAGVKMPTTSVLSEPADAARAAREIIGNNAYEVFLVLYVDVRNTIIGYEELTENSMTGVSVATSGVVRNALLAAVPAVITVHNHPSGNLDPSDDDRELWARLRKELTAQGVQLLDNLIVSSGAGYYSQSEGRQQLAGSRGGRS